MDGDTLVVGCPGDNSLDENDANDGPNDIGSAYVFVHANGTWTQRAYLKSHDPRPNQAFASRLAISGDTVVVTSFKDNSCGAGVNDFTTTYTCADVGSAHGKKILFRNDYFQIRFIFVFFFKLKYFIILFIYYYFIFPFFFVYSFCS